MLQAVQPIHRKMDGESHRILAKVSAISMAFNCERRSARDFTRTLIGERRRTDDVNGVDLRYQLS